jgi:hypothetical protein
MKLPEELRDRIIALTMEYWDITRISNYFPGIKYYYKPENPEDWLSLSMQWYSLTQDLIRVNSDLVNWDYISKYQILSEEFIREFKDRVNWSLISKHQDDLSEEFIIEFEDRVDWKEILKYQCWIRDPFYEKYKLKYNL